MIAVDSLHLNSTIAGKFAGLRETLTIRILTSGKELLSSIVNGKKRCALGRSTERERENTTQTVVGKFIDRVQFDRCQGMCKKRRSHNVRQLQTVR